jgi:hypothetical protein
VPLQRRCSIGAGTAAGAVLAGHSSKKAFGQLKGLVGEGKVAENEKPEHQGKRLKSGHAPPSRAGG